MNASAPLARRRGPRPAGNTRTLLLDVAEQLFAEHGADAVSLRTVAATAGVASSALHYHFPSGDDLLREVLARRATGLGVQTRELLTQVRAGPEMPTVAALVDALLTPWLHLLAAEPAGGRRFVNVVSALLAVNDPRLWPHLALVNESFAAAVAALPERRTRDMQRWRIAAKCLVHGLGTGDDPQQLRAFVIAGVSHAG